MPKLPPRVRKPLDRLAQPNSILVDFIWPAAAERHWLGSGFDTLTLGSAAACLQHDGAEEASCCCLQCSACLPLASS